MARGQRSTRLLFQLFLSAAKPSAARPQSRPHYVEWSRRSAATWSDIMRPEMSLVVVAVGGRQTGEWLWAFVMVGLWGGRPGRLTCGSRSEISGGTDGLQTRRWRETDSNLWFLVSTTAKIVSHVASRVISAVRRGWLAFAPNGREPRLPMPRQSRGAVVMAHLHEAGQGDVIAPSVEVEEAGITIVAQTLLVIPSRI